MIDVICEDCNETLEAPDELEGSTAKCPQCGSIIDVNYEPNEVKDFILSVKDKTLWQQFIIFLGLWKEFSDALYNLSWALLKLLILCSFIYFLLKFIFR